LTPSISHANLLASYDEQLRIDIEYPEARREVTVDDQPAAVAWTYFPLGQFAMLFAGSTISEFRKQGLYTGLLATRLQENRERAYRFAVVEAGSMSRPIVAKHGFQHLTTMYDFEWKEKQET
jgi:hypothetical protein